MSTYILQWKSCRNIFRVRSLQTHHCQILSLCYVYSNEGVWYWPNDGNCLDPGIWRAISSTSQIDNDASMILTICVSLRQRRYTMTHQCLPCGKLDNILAGKNVPVRSLQIMVITSPGFRTDQMWLSNQTTGVWMLKMTMYDCNCVSRGILVFCGCILVLCNMYYVLMAPPNEHTLFTI